MPTNQYPWNQEPSEELKQFVSQLRGNGPAPYSTEEVESIQNQREELVGSIKSQFLEYGSAITQICAARLAMLTGISHAEACSVLLYILPLLSALSKVDEAVESWNSIDLEQHSMGFDRNTQKAFELLQEAKEAIEEDTTQQTRMGFEAATGVTVEEYFDRIKDVVRKEDY